MQPPLPILMYHAIGNPSCDLEAAYTTPVDTFKNQMRLLTQAGYRTLTVSELMNRWEAGEQTSDKSVVITFDDGFACLHEQALPIMESHGFRATVYLVSGYLDRMGRFDSDLQIRGRPMLSRSQVQDLLAAGMEIGSHTVNHPDLRQLSAAGLRSELRRSREELQDLTGTSVSSFCYPRGLFDRTVHEAVIEAGYRSACSTLPGLADSRDDRLLLRRAQVGSQTDSVQFMDLLRHGNRAGRIMRPRIREQIIRAAATLRGYDPMDFYRRPMRQAFGYGLGGPD